ncbi:VWA domain-containing protein [Dyella sp. BiH032]|uniref:VWA domain-containing protein n=1 Tax=Dyella sp. BiH032 TaxID=3075430 RepID=UPI002892E41E|nr:VWA domain-containing protein [Dyella sp. BiH032]WNL46929.1 VWA domain-containing protein [Dyella sp. BiH032]
MMAWWHDFHFLRPWWLLGLLLVPLVYALAARGGRERRELARLIDAELMPYVLQGASARGRAWPPILLAAGTALCALAFAGPAWDRVASPLYASRAAQVVAVSLSRHMLARDVAPSRIDRARYKARDLLAANRTGLNGLVAYAGEAFAVAPLTTDAGSLNDLLDALSPDTMPTDGNDAAQAIERGAALIHDAKAGGGDLIVLTDGADAAAQAAARQARREGVRVSVLGIGTPQGSPVPDGEGGLLRDNRGDVVVARRDDDALRALADAGGGRYVPIADDDRDIAALKPGDSPGQSLVQADGQHADEWQDRGPWLLLPLLAIAALAFRRGWLLVLPLALLPCLPSTAQAGTWSDLWRRPDQQAAAALRQGDAKQAQALARDPALRGAAAYRAADYAAAAEAWQGVPGADAAYNLGNALAKQGQYKEAIAAYDRALKENPALADAKANRQAVEDWLRQQPPSQDKKQDDKQDKHGSGKGDGGAKGQPGKGDEQQGDKKDDKDKPGEDAKNGDQGDRADARPDAGSKGEQNGQGPEKKGQGEAKPPSAQEQAEQKAQAEQARQALQKQMDQALREGKGGAGESSHELGAVAADDPQAKLPADVRRALQRVPDDPGALLRRKFELEYRQRHGDAGEGD